MSFERVMAAEDLWDGEIAGVVVRGTRVLLTNVEGAVRAYADRCAHKGVELSRGVLAGRVLTCWAHGWQYDLVTGEGVNPCGMFLVKYPAMVDGGQIWVDVDA